MSEILKSTETIRFSAPSSFQLADLKIQNQVGPDMPIDLHGHCMFKMTDETAMIMGGESSQGLQDSIISYINTMNEFLILNVRIKQKRKDHACAAFHSQESGHQWVVIVGGMVEQGTKAKTEVRSN